MSRFEMLRGREKSSDDANADGINVNIRHRFLDFH